MRAVWRDETIAESDDTTVVDGYHYFPRASVREDALIESPTRTSCAWKGDCSYYSLIVDGHVLDDGAFYYAEPKPGAADQVGDRIAFWKDVEVVA
ncbi:MAG: hypothetical protein JWN72_1466 [Thermoleophilia bacterium]|nr:hypothetical protein [Thermoleophilia bacterium]